jgi:hypothetical protein
MRQYGRAPKQQRLPTGTPTTAYRRGQSAIRQPADCTISTTFVP